MNRLLTGKSTEFAIPDHANRIARQSIGSDRNEGVLAVFDSEDIGEGGSLLGSRLDGLIAGSIGFHLPAPEAATSIMPNRPPSSPRRFSAYVCAPRWLRKPVRTVQTPPPGKNPFTWNIGLDLLSRFWLSPLSSRAHTRRRFIPEAQRFLSPAATPILVGVFPPYAAYGLAAHRFGLRATNRATASVYSPVCLRPVRRPLSERLHGSGGTGFQKSRLALFVARNPNFQRARKFLSASLIYSDIMSRIEVNVKGLCAEFEGFLGKFV